VTGSRTDGQMPLEQQAKSRRSGLSSLPHTVHYIAENVGSEVRKDRVNPHSTILKLVQPAAASLTNVWRMALAPVCPHPTRAL
jgi:hypothetical protein